MVTCRFKGVVCGVALHNDPELRQKTADSVLEMSATAADKLVAKMHGRLVWQPMMSFVNLLWWRTVLGASTNDDVT